MTLSADIIINARVLTMDEAAPRGEAIAIVGNEIAFIGSGEDAEGLRRAHTRVIDAEGGTVLPGFIEAHMHIFPGSAELDTLNLHGVRGLDRLAEKIRDYAAAKPDAALLVGNAADYTILSAEERVTRHHLDRIIKDRPFAMASPDHHTMWANTIALDRAGILKGGEVGTGNEIVMGADGLANGELREGGAFSPVLDLADGGGRERLGLSTGGEPDPAPTAGERRHDREVLKRGLRHLASHGITSFHNMDGNLYQLELLSEIDDAGELPARLYRGHCEADRTDSGTK